MFVQFRDASSIFRPSIARQHAAYWSAKPKIASSATMASLQMARKARELTLANKPARLYRCIMRELPKVLVIYDVVNIGEDDARKAIRTHFYNEKDVKDPRVIDMLVEKGYMDLEDTLLQHKQKTHLMMLLESYIGTDYNNKQLGPESSEEEQFARWVH